MTIDQLKENKKILIVGYGVEGKAVHEFLKEHCPDVEIGIADRNDGASYLAPQKDYDLAIKSPGVLPSLIKIPYTTVTNIFMSNCRGKTIGVTGTKGKGTTASLIYEMLKEDGKDVYLGGNIGEPPINFVDKLTDQSWTVLELSSFQLQDVQKSPHIAVLLMITSDHLDYHNSIKEYVDAKRNILHFQTEKDFAVINRDYPASNESDILTEGKIFYFSRERETNNSCFALNNKIIVRKNESDDEIVDISDILLPGKHNLENITAAVMAARLAGVSKDSIISVLKSFKGLEHRLELIAEVNGVKYYDDSFSAVPEATIAAIEAFGAPEILILGGSSKNSDFSELGKVIGQAKNIKAIIGIGVEWERIKEEIKDRKGVIMVLEGAKSMEQIVAAASKIAQPGDVVLLSPACASFDMFKNYKDRGEQFRRVVSLLK